MKNSKTNGITVSTAEKRHRALELRKDCYTFQEIAYRLGCSKGQAYKLVAKGLAELTERVRSSADELRELENARLDDLWLCACELSIDASTVFENNSFNPCFSGYCLRIEPNEQNSFMASSFQSLF